MSRRVVRCTVLSAACALAFASSVGLGVAGAQPRFEERSTQWGIVHGWLGFTGEGGGGNFGGGAAIEDFDQDGDLDVFLGNAAGTPLSVFCNQGGGVFLERGESLGFGDLGTSKQLLVVDLDGDGYRDLLATSWAAQTRLFRGQSGGFVDVTAQSGLLRTLDATFPGLATGACAGDVDRDGDLDLYLSYWKAGTPSPASANTLYRNDGGLRFTDVTAASGAADQRKSFQSVLVDLDGDGWLDLLVAEDKPGGMTCFHNDGDGTFTDLSAASGLVGRVTTSGRLATAMGIAIGDYDNDGDPDVYVTNIEDGNLLYRNDSAPGLMAFVERAAPAGVLSQRFAWGTAFFDCDNDGWLDLYVADTGSGSGAGSEDRFFLNQRDGTFLDMAPQVGLDDDGNAYAAACGDLDGDGDVDLVVTHDTARTLVFANPAAGAHWLRLRLRGAGSNPDAVGAHVRVLAAGQTQTREVLAGTSYLSHDSLELEVGLGAATVVDAIEVRWPNGQRESFGGLSQVDRSYLLVAGTAVPTASRLLAFRAVAVAGVGQDGTAGIDLGWKLAGDGAVTLWRALGGRAAELARDLPPTGNWRDQLQGVDSQQAAHEVTYRLVDQAGDIVLGEVTAALRRIARGPRHPVLSPPTPNPFNPHVALEVLVPDGAAGSRATLAILDARGRSVAVVYSGPLPAERLATAWDGRDAAGRPAPSGAYRAVLEAAGSRQAVPLVLLR